MCGTVPIFRLQFKVHRRRWSVQCTPHEDCDSIVFCDDPGHFKPRCAVDIPLIGFPGSTGRTQRPPAGHLVERSEIPFGSPSAEFAYSQQIDLATYKHTRQRTPNEAIISNVAAACKSTTRGIALVKMPLATMVAMVSIPGRQRRLVRLPMLLSVNSAACFPAKMIRQIICRVFAYTREISGVTHSTGTLGSEDTSPLRIWRITANVPPKISEQPAMTPLCRATLCVSVVAEKNASRIPLTDMMGRYRVM